MKLFYKCLNKKEYNYKDYIFHAVQSYEIENIRKWRNDQIDVLRQAKYITESTQLEYYQKNIWNELNDPKPTNILLSINKDQNHIGYGGLVHNKWDDRCAEISFIVDTNIINNKKKYKIIFNLFLNFIKNLSFNELNIYKLYTETYSFRQYHINILESFGFIREGILKEHFSINDKRYDSIFHAIFNR